MERRNKLFTARSLSASSFNPRFFYPIGYLGVLPYSYYYLKNLNILKNV